MRLHILVTKRELTGYDADIVVMKYFKTRPNRWLRTKIVAHALWNQGFKITGHRIGTIARNNNLEIRKTGNVAHYRYTQTSGGDNEN